MSKSIFKHRPTLALTAALLVAAGCQTVAPVQTPAGETVSGTNTATGSGGNTNTATAKGTTVTDPNGNAVKNPGTATVTNPGDPVKPADPKPAAVGATTDRMAGLSHKGEFEKTYLGALKDVTPIMIDPVKGGSFTTPDGMLVTIPPFALSGESAVPLRLKKADTSTREVNTMIIPGISYYMDMGSAHVLPDQQIKIKSLVDARAVDELKKRDPNFDPANYSLSQNDKGLWELTMAVSGPTTKPAEEHPTDLPQTKMKLTVDLADPTQIPVPIWQIDGSVTTNTRFNLGQRKLSGADGASHIDGLYYFQDVKIDAIRECIEEDEEANFRPIEELDTKDANGNPTRTRTSTFNPVTHQQNCDFADAGCPSAGALGQIVQTYNHIVTTRFASDYVDSKTGSAHCAGKLKRPPKAMLDEVERIRKEGACIVEENQVKVYGQSLWWSDQTAINNTPAVSILGGPVNHSYKGIAGGGGNESRPIGRERVADSRGMAFEWLAIKGYYNIVPYYYDDRFPSGKVVGDIETGLVRDINYESNPVKVFLPRFSPRIICNLTSGDLGFQDGEKVRITYNVDGGEALTATQIVEPFDYGELPRTQQPTIVTMDAAKKKAYPISFYASVNDDRTHTFQLLDVAGTNHFAGPDSIKAAKFARVFRNGNYEVNVQMFGNKPK